MAGLYHARVPLKTTGFPGAGLFHLAAVSPPGNEEREIALYRRSLFAALGVTTALAFPCAIPLAFMAPGRGPAAAGNLEGALGAAWEGAVGSFISAGIVERSGAYYLGMSGPLEGIARRLREILPAARAGLPAVEPPLACALGFFLCLGRPGLPAPPPPPAVAFTDCALVVYRLELGDDPWAAMRWTCLARAERHSGRPLRPAASR